MKRSECFEFLAPLINDQLVIGSLSGQRVEWGDRCQHEGNLLVASMGAALGIGIGLAMVLPHRKVIVLESDGSMLLSLYNLPTLGNINPPNLAVFRQRIETARDAIAHPFLREPGPPIGTPWQSSPRMAR